MPWIDYGDYARSQSDWAHSLLKKATKSDPATAEDLGRKAKDALHRVASHLQPRTGVGARAGFDDLGRA